MVCDVLSPGGGRCIAMVCSRVGSRRASQGPLIHLADIGKPAPGALAHALQPTPASQVRKSAEIVRLLGMGWLQSKGSRRCNPAVRLLLFPPLRVSSFAFRSLAGKGSPTPISRNRRRHSIGAAGSSLQPAPGLGVSLYLYSRSPPAAAAVVPSRRNALMTLRPTFHLWTSSGPSTRRCERICVYHLARIVSWL